MNHLPGSVDKRTGNVPLTIGGEHQLHYEGRRDDGAFLVRFGISKLGPVHPFASVQALLTYVEDMRELAPMVSVDGVADWLDTRLAEPAR